MNIIKKLYIKFKILTGDSNALVVYLRDKGIIIGDNVRFRAPQTDVIDISRPALVEIGSNIDFNHNFTLLTHDFSSYVFRNLYNDFVPSSGRVKIGNNIVFGRNVTVMKGVTIGDNCIIGLGAVITKSIPEGSVVVGAPARVICTVDEYYARRKKETIEEALDYGCCIMDRYNRDPRIEDFPEEWSLFIKKEEYEKNSTLQKYVDFRLKDLSHLWEKEKPFNGFNDFLEAIKEYKYGNR